MAAIIPSAKASADFDATFTVDDQDRLSKAVLEGPFYPKADSVIYTISDADELREAVLKGAFYGEDKGELTYDLTLDEYGTEKEITAP